MSTKTQTAKAPLTERIMAAIAKASSKRPSNTDDVLALIGGDEADFWSAIEQLWRDTRITGATMYRPQTDAAPWLGIWPTGVPLSAGAWTGPRLSFLFVRHDTAALKKAHAPRSKARRATEAA
ncbi:hypothetical protein [Thauera sp.]|uniref:hypothetical protein n=1 Tax=Thauera sp. TaxID=1905334 RepID=UPI0039E49E3F